jgi:hypothetical protein
VSYLSDGLLGSSDNPTLPIQTTIISLPGAGATPYPGTGFGDFRSDYDSFAFDVSGSLQYLFQVNTQNITGPGTYAIQGGQAQNGFVNYTPSGDVVVQQVSPSSYFQYTETFNATRFAGATIFTYDSPVFLNEVLAIDPGSVTTISAPVPGALPTDNLFATGNGDDEGYYVAPNGDAFYVNGAVSAPFTSLGTYNFSSATYTEYDSSGNLLYTDANETGSISVSLVSATPEPASWELLGAGAITLAAWGWRRSRA